MAKAAAETVAVKVGVTVAEVRAVAARAVEVMGGRRWRRWRWWWRRGRRR